jgi:hypothetical protein
MKISMKVVARFLTGLMFEDELIESDIEILSFSDPSERP